MIQAAVSNGLGPASFARPLLVATLAALAVLALLWLVLRNQAVAALFATALLLLVASHDPVIDVLTAARAAWGAAGAVVVIGAAMFLPLAAIVVGVDQFRRGHLGPPITRSATAGLNVFSVALLVVVLLQGAGSVSGWLQAPGGRAAAIPPAGSDAQPDIYLFLLDGYSRADELQRQFGIDNSAFLTELEFRGFDVDEASRTNYTYTALTLTAMLSMDYIPVADSHVVSELDLRGHLHMEMRSGPAVTALRDAGYELVATAPGWEQVSIRPGADRYLDRPELNDFEMALLRRTWLPDVPPIPADLFFDSLRARISGVLDDAASVAAETRSRPTFTFVHVPAPHLPIAFGRDGEPTRYSSRQYLAGRASEFGLSDEGYTLAYAASLSYLNARMIETVEAIQAASARPPVIVIMSDHGYNGDSPVHTEAMLHNLFAAHTPQHPRLLESVTPVNLLRVLLETYAGAHLGQPVADRFFTTVISGGVGAYDLALTEVVDP